MENLIYVGVLIVILALIVGIIYVKKHNLVSKDDLELTDMVVDLLPYIVKQFDFKYEEGVVRIIGYVADALDFVIVNYDELDKKTNDEIKELIFDKAKQICESEGIVCDETVLKIISESADYIVKKYF